METLNPVETLTATIVDWAEQAIAMLPNLAVALIVMIAFYALGRLVRIVLQRLLSSAGVAPAASNVLTRIAQYALLFAGVAAALGVLNLSSAAASLLAGAGVVGLALGFAFQDIAANFIAGLFLSFRRPFSIGDIVEIDDSHGHVRDLALRTTKIETFDGRTLWVPNKKLFENVLHNVTGNGRRRLEVSVGVSYGDDLDLVERVTCEALTAVPGRDESKDPEMFFTGFGGSSIDLVARIWLDDVDQRPFLLAQHRAIKEIAKAYAANDITIPFPIRTMDFGIKGGIALSEQLLNKSAAT